jgi:transcriptional regulator with XRE-family HTH domain
MPEVILRSHKDVLAEARKDPEFEKAYRLLGPRHQVIREIVNLRNEKGLTQTQLAKKARTHQSRISKIETGKGDLQLSTLAALAEALDADLEVRLVPRQPEAFYVEALAECARRVKDIAIDFSIAGGDVGMHLLALPVSDWMPASVTRHEQANIG